jgi:hypothetical protein
MKYWIKVQTWYCQEATVEVIADTEREAEGSGVKVRHVREAKRGRKVS